MYFGENVTVFYFLKQQHGKTYHEVTASRKVDFLVAEGGVRPLDPPAMGEHQQLISLRFNGYFSRCIWVDRYHS